MRHYDAYRIGYHWWERWSMLWTWGTMTQDDPPTWRKSTDRWHRTWQCEWEGCSRAVRAWTRQGVLRKAVRKAGS